MSARRCETNTTTHLTGHSESFIPAFRVRGRAQEWFSGPADTRAPFTPEPHFISSSSRMFLKFLPIQQRLLKNTDPSHPDHALLLAAQREVHDLAVKIDSTRTESLELEQQQRTLRDLETLIEGLVDLPACDRVYLRTDTVTMVTGQGTRKERALFLFSDLLIITSIKRRTGPIKKPVP